MLIFYSNQMADKSGNKKSVVANYAQMSLFFPLSAFFTTALRVTLPLRPFKIKELCCKLRFGEASY
jgi:hypothetical protein